MALDASTKLCTPTDAAPKSPGNVVIAKVTLSDLMAAIAQEGEAAVQAACGVSRSAMMRALAGLSVRRGTAALVSQYLDSRRAASEVKKTFEPVQQPQETPPIEA